MKRKHEKTDDRLVRKKKNTDENIELAPISDLSKVILDVGEKYDLLDNNKLKSVKKEDKEKIQEIYELIMRGSCSRFENEVTAINHKTIQICFLEILEKEGTKTFESFLINSKNNSGRFFQKFERFAFDLVMKLFESREHESEFFSSLQHTTDLNTSFWITTVLKRDIKKSDRLNALIKWAKASKERGQCIERRDFLIGVYQKLYNQSSSESTKDKIQTAIRHIREQFPEPESEMNNQNRGNSNPYFFNVPSFQQGNITNMLISEEPHHIYSSGQPAITLKTTSLGVYTSVSPGLGQLSNRSMPMIGSFGRNIAMPNPVRDTRHRFESHEFNPAFRGFPPLTNVIETSIMGSDSVSTPFYTENVNPNPFHNRQRFSQFIHQNHDSDLNQNASIQNPAQPIRSSSSISEPIFNLSEVILDVGKKNKLLENNKLKSVKKEDKEKFQEIYKLMLRGGGSGFEEEVTAISYKTIKICLLEILEKEGIKKLESFLINCKKDNRKFFRKFEKFAFDLVMKLFKNREHESVFFSSLHMTGDMDVFFWIRTILKNNPEKKSDRLDALIKWAKGSKEQDQCAERRDFLIGVYQEIYNSSSSKRSKDVAQNAIQCIKKQLPEPEMNNQNRGNQTPYFFKAPSFHQEGITLEPISEESLQQIAPPKTEERGHLRQLYSSEDITLRTAPFGGGNTASLNPLRDTRNQVESHEFNPTFPESESPSLTDMIMETSQFLAAISSLSKMGSQAQGKKPEESEELLSLKSVASQSDSQSGPALPGASPNGSKNN